MPRLANVQESSHAIQSLPMLSRGPKEFGHYFDDRAEGGPVLEVRPLGTKGA